ncbi:MAG: hypothetical protein HGA44_05555, partial [Cellulomonadaceae bacterium]|nr:hypothetical protein [Cellulomonadaceae bacterium]
MSTPSPRPPAESTGDEVVAPTTPDATPAAALPDGAAVPTDGAGPLVDDPATAEASSAAVTSPPAESPVPEHPAPETPARE